MSRKAKRSSSSGLTRRVALRTGGRTLAGLALAAAIPSVRAAPGVEVRMRSLGNGARVVFDPIGLLVAPGTVVRWVIEAGVHTTTAYHPRNDSHALRIPEGAVPWDSGYLVNLGDSFEVALTEEGVYDYFCAPHERAGMVGRIIVGRALGPGARPFDYFAGDPAAAAWQPVPAAARDAFPTVAEIMAKRVVPGG